MLLVLNFLKLCLKESFILYLHSNSSGQRTIDIIKYIHPQINLSSDERIDFELSQINGIGQSYTYGRTRMDQSSSRRQRINRYKGRRKYTVNGNGFVDGIANTVGNVAGTC